MWEKTTTLKFRNYRPYRYTNLFLSLLSGGFYFLVAWTCTLHLFAVRNYDNIIATIVKTSTLFICKNLLPVIELSDYGVIIQRRQEHLLEKKDVPIELQKEMSKIITIVKK